MHEQAPVSQTAGAQDPDPSMQRLKMAACTVPVITLVPLQRCSWHKEPLEAYASAVHRLCNVTCLSGSRMTFHPVRSANFGSWQGHGSHGWPSHVQAAGQGRSTEVAGWTCAEPTDTGHLRGCLCSRSMSPEPALRVLPMNKETHT